ncbi:hypothetical protein RRG08_065025 [Elysia crispata]|uniref:Uncharacterized protein n=1 Tax=Elysia crispata TaxID=231223 RepID=A0AAE0YR21_9GAST|nr:hypothetical protein RRG08_065025 [Elysia crispata]
MRPHTHLSKTSSYTQRRAEVTSTDFRTILVSWAYHVTKTGLNTTCSGRVPHHKDIVVLHVRSRHTGENQSQQNSLFLTSTKQHGRIPSSFSP